MTTKHVWLGVLLAATGCLDAGEPEVGTAAQAVTSSCPKWGCGENSPILGPFNFHELDEKGSANDAGLRLVGFRKGGKDYRPNVTGSRLVATAADGEVLSGTALENGFFVVRYPAVGDLPAGAANIIITKVSHNVTMWRGPATTVETYELQYTMPINFASYAPLCKNPPALTYFSSGPPRAIDGEGKEWTNRFEAILYTGDHYDAGAKTVAPGASNWFNIGCAGGALAKLYLNRHTQASSTTGYTTTNAQRQTMLKMYTGDFCGDGQAYTRQGAKIHWQNDAGAHSPSGNDTSGEALWDQDGARCLDRHRLANSLDAVEAGWEDELKDPITGCVPDCDLSAVTAPFGGAYLLTRSAAPY